MCHESVRAEDLQREWEREIEESLESGEEPDESDELEPAERTVPAADD